MCWKQRVELLFVGVSSSNECEASSVWVNHHRCIGVLSQCSAARARAPRRHDGSAELYW